MDCGRKLLKRVRLGLLFNQYKTFSGRMVFKLACKQSFAETYPCTRTKNNGHISIIFLERLPHGSASIESWNCGHGREARSDELASNVSLPLGDVVTKWITKNNIVV